jgi:hypothetical protein
MSTLSGTPTMPAIFKAFESINTKSKRPILRLANVYIYNAPKTGMNKGSLYVKETGSGKYLGKIGTDGIFSTRELVNTEIRVEIETATNYPMQATQNFGRKTGNCSCCGKLLTNPLSVKLGIGPICRGNWFPISDASAFSDLSTDEPCNPCNGRAEAIVKQESLGLESPLALLGAEEILLNLEPDALLLHEEPEQEEQCERERYLAAKAALGLESKLPEQEQGIIDIDIPTIDSLVEAFKALETKGQLLFMTKLAASLVISADTDKIFKEIS